MFLYSTVSTLNPMARDQAGKHVLGMVEITSPSCRRYKIVVFPALSRPSIKIRMGAWRRHRKRASYSDEKVTPMAIRAYLRLRRDVVTTVEQRHVIQMPY